MTSSFNPASGPPPSTDGAVWIVLRGGAVLVHGGSVLAPSPSALGLAAARTVYLGTLDGKPCFAADVEGADGDDRFAPFRAAFALAPPDLGGVLSTAAELVHFERTSVFCERCASRLEGRAGERAKKCPSCGHEVYPRVSPAIIVLVRDGAGRAILAHRPAMPFFSLVAGFVESGESFEECVCREVKEEVGVEVGAERYFGSQPWPFPHQIMVGFFAWHVRGDIRVDGHEVDEARWFTKDDLPTLPPSVSIARRLVDAWLDEVR